MQAARLEQQADEYDRRCAKTIDATGIETEIEAAAAPTASVNRGTAHLCIADPLGRPMNQREGAWSNLFASHPPMAARIAALKEMAFQGSSR